MKNDIASEHFISSWPNWVRWVLFVLGSILAGVLYLLFISISGFLFDSISRGFLLQLLSSAIIGFMFVYGGTWVAPQKQFAISIFLLIVLTAISTLPFLFSFGPYSPTGPIEYGINVLAVLVSAGYTVHIVKETKNRGSE